VESVKFDALSQEELYLFAEKMGLDLPRGLERVFVLEEILEALDEDAAERSAAPDDAVHVDEKKYAGCSQETLAASPDERVRRARRYCETMIRAIARDPSWAFAYWDLSEVDRGRLHSDDGQSSLFLRVSELDSEDERKREYYDIPVSDDDYQWYINLPRSGVRFRIDLCARPAGRHRVLARSNEVEAPRQGLSQTAGDLDEPALALLRLSGLESLNIAAPGVANPQRILPANADSEASYAELGAADTDAACLR
jgi:hypothetical protein